MARHPGRGGSIPGIVTSGLAGKQTGGGQTEPLLGKAAADEYPRAVSRAFRPLMGPAREDPPPLSDLRAPRRETITAGQWRKTRPRPAFSPPVTLAERMQTSGRPPTKRFFKSQVHMAVAVAPRSESSREKIGTPGFDFAQKSAICRMSGDGGRPLARTRERGGPHARASAMGFRRAIAPAVTLVRRGGRPTQGTQHVAIGACGTSSRWRGATRHPRQPARSTHDGSQLHEVRTFGACLAGTQTATECPLMPRGF